MSALNAEPVLAQNIILAQGTTTIGREENNSIVLESTTVSLNHARIFTLSETSHILDLDSKNGIYVNGKKTHHHILRAGDSVVIGDYIFIIDGFE